MKTFRLSIVLLVLLGAVSCKKDNSASTSVTTDQAADLAAGSLASDSFGLTTVSDAVAVNAQTLSSTGGQSVNSLGASSVHQACGTTLTDSITNSGSDGPRTFSYTVKFVRTLNCNVDQHPDNLANNVAFHGNFDGPNLTTTGAGTAVFTIAGLTQQATNFVINGEYKRTGSFQSKVGNKTSGQSDIDIVATNITLAKPSRKIVSGSATISITGSTTKNGSYSYTGNIVFNGDGTATLTINGSVYGIDLVTGVRVKH